MTYTIKEASEHIGVSTRQVRRYIKEGKLEANLIIGKYGKEYQIEDIPPELVVEKPVESTLDNTLRQALALVHSLQQENRDLAGALGASQERARTLENQVLLLTAPKTSFWSRLFKRKSP